MRHCRDTAIRLAAEALARGEGARVLLHKAKQNDNRATVMEFVGNQQQPQGRMTPWTMSIRNSVGSAPMPR